MTSHNNLNIDRSFFSKDQSSQPDNINNSGNNYGRKNSENNQVPNKYGQEDEFSQQTTNQDSQPFGGQFDDQEQISPTAKEQIKRYQELPDFTVSSGPCNQAQINAQIDIGNNDQNSDGNISEYSTKNLVLNQDQQNHQGRQQDQEEEEEEEKKQAPPQSVINNKAGRKSNGDGTPHVIRSILRDFRRMIIKNPTLKEKIRTIHGKASFAQLQALADQDNKRYRKGNALEKICKKYNKARKEKLFKSPTILTAFKQCYPLLKEKYEQRKRSKTLHVRNQRGKKYDAGVYLEHLERIYAQVMEILRSFGDPAL